MSWRKRPRLLAAPGTAEVTPRPPPGGGVVTSAALVMVAVFSIFGTLGAIEFQQMGVGLTAAILIDATLVRAVLLTATTKLLGERNRYLPRGLAWLPRIGGGAVSAQRAQPAGRCGARREAGTVAVRSAAALARPPLGGFALEVDLGGGCGGRLALTALVDGLLRRAGLGTAGSGLIGHGSSCCERFASEAEHWDGAAQVVAATRASVGLKAP